jgi:hypothetical protein
MNFVYFIQAGCGGPIKIGTSRNPSRRFAQLQTASPTQLIPLGLMMGGVKLERALHAAVDDVLPAARLNGEWFTPLPGLLDFIRAAVSPWDVGLAVYHREEERGHGRRAGFYEWLAGQMRLAGLADDDPLSRLLGS